MQEQLGLEGMPQRLVRVTPARLATWDDCPRRYRMTYLDRPTPSRRPASAPATLGAVVHNALRALLDMPTERRTAERAARLVHQYWKSDGFAGPEQAAHYRRRAADWVADYAAALDPVSEPVALERWVYAPVGSIRVEGRVDRVDQRDGALVVVDYKTGRHVLTTDDAEASRALALYALAVRHTMRRPCHRVELHHLPTGTVASWEHSEKSLTEHRRHAENTAAELQGAADARADGGADDRLFPPRPGRRCAWCEFRDHCPEGQQAAPERPSWALLAE